MNITPNNWQVPLPPGVVDEPYPPEFAPLPPEGYMLPEEMVLAPPVVEGPPVPTEQPPGQLIPGGYGAYAQIPPDFTPMPPEPTPEGPPAPSGPLQPGGLRFGGYAPPPPPEQPSDMEALQGIRPPPLTPYEQLTDARANQQRVFAEGSAQNAQDYRQRLDVAQLQKVREDDIAAKAEQDVNAAWEEVKDAKVDPKNYWKSLGPGGKVAAVIGAVIGGFLQARQQKNSNAFLDIIQQEIQNDIHAQEVNIANLRAGAQGKESVYARMLGRFQNAQVARSMTAATYYDAASRETAAKVAALQSPITRAEGAVAAQQMAAQAEVEKRKALQQLFENNLALDEQMRKDADTRSQIMKRNAPGAAGTPPNALGVYSDVNRDGRVDKLDLTDEQRKSAIYNEYGEPIVDPKTGSLLVGQNPGEGAKLGKGLSQAKQARAALAEYDRLRRSYGREFGGDWGLTEGAKKMNAQRAIAVKSIKLAWDLGAITDSDYELINSALPPVAGTTKISVNDEAIPRIIQDLDAGVDATMTGLGYSGSYSQDMHKRVTPKQGGVATDSTQGIEVDITDPREKAKMEAKRQAAESKAGQEQAGREALDAIPSLGSSLLVVSKGKVIRVPDDKSTRAKLKSGAYRLASPDEQSAYQPKNGILVVE